MAADQPAFIDYSFVVNNLQYKDLIPGIEEAFALFTGRNETEILQPLRTTLNINEHDSYFLVMPAYSSSKNVFTTKILSCFPKNLTMGKPSHQAHLLLYDGSTGALKAIMDAHDVTTKRTAAASAVATKLLAPENTKIHAILGAGGQAKSHLQALNAIYDFEEIRVWNHNFPKAELFAKKYGCKAFESAEEAVRGADVITVVTMASKPVLFMDWVKRGTHINAVGAPVPFMQEIDPTLMRSSVVYTDSRESATQESGDVILSKADVYAEMGEVIMGTKEAKREETTIFKSLGMAIEDLVAAKIVYDKYMESSS